MIFNALGFPFVTLLLFRVSPVCDLEATRQVFHIRVVGFSWFSHLGCWNFSISSQGLVSFHGFVFWVFNFSCLLFWFLISPCLLIWVGWFFLISAVFEFDFPGCSHPFWFLSESGVFWTLDLQLGLAWNWLSSRASFEDWFNFFGRLVSFLSTFGSMGLLPGF